MSKPVVGICTDFFDFMPGYSLCHVATTEAGALKRAGFKVVFFLRESVSEETQKFFLKYATEVRAVIPTVPASNDGVVDAINFDKHVDLMVEAYNKNFSDIDVMITHDFVLQNALLTHNAAMYKANLPKLRWFHRIHSNPQPRPEKLEYPIGLRWSVPPNSKILWANQSGQARISEWYRIPFENVIICPISRDIPDWFGFHELSERITREFNLLECDIVQTYPMCSTRMEHKGLPEVIRIFSQIKQLFNAKVCLVVCNANMGTDVQVLAVKEAQRKAYSWGLSPRELVFTGLYDFQYRHGVPHQVVRDLHLVSNVFICPSKVETFGMAAMEAALTPKIVLVNYDTTCLVESGGPFSLKFGFTSFHGGPIGEESINRQVGGVLPIESDPYMRSMAEKIWACYRTDRALLHCKWIMKEFNADRVARDIIIPEITKE